MGLSQVAISVCNDGNVAQLDVTDTLNGGVYYRIEVYRASQPSGGYGVTLSGSRVEDICGIDHLTRRSNQVFRYTFSLGDDQSHRGDLPTILEGREEFNPPGMPDGSWDVRIRDVDAESPSYGSVIRATVAPNGKPQGYDIHYELRLADPNIKPVPIRSPLARKITELNPGLSDLGLELDKLPPTVGLLNNLIVPQETLPQILSLADTTKSLEIDEGLSSVLNTIAQPQFARFLKNLNAYEEFGDFGAKATHPGTNLTGPNAKLAAESIFVRQYRAALVLLGRITSPDMKRGAAELLSVARAVTNTRPGVYAIFVGAAVNHIGIYKLGLDKVHSDYGGVPMKLAPGSRLENDALPVVDAWSCNQTLGEIANRYYLADPPKTY
jgi:hypothetical protein